MSNSLALAFGLLTLTILGLRQIISYQESIIAQMDDRFEALRQEHEKFVAIDAESFKRGIIKLT